MKKSISKTDAKKNIEEFFKDMDNKTPKKIKKLKRFAMSYNIPLKEKRKLFCKKCYSVYQKPKVMIKNKIKSVVCENCGNANRWKL
ncbi:MAG: hypothetical protein ABIA78_00165 [archaeon]